MKAQYIRLYPGNPEMKKIDHIVTVLRNGGLVIYPTDTIYGVGCDLFNKKAISRLIALLDIRAKDLNLSFICHDLSHVAEFTRHISTPIFKIMKKALPGPYTFILESSSKVPKLLGINKKTVGIRIPGNNVPLEIVRTLGNPIISASLKDEDKIVQYITDPDLIYERYSNTVDIVINAGFGHNVPSTVVDCIGKEAVIVRKGAGDVSVI